MDVQVPAPMLIVLASANLVVSMEAPSAVVIPIVPLFVKAPSD